MGECDDVRKRRARGRPGSMFLGLRGGLTRERNAGYIQQQRAGVGGRNLLNSLRREPVRVLSLDDLEVI